MIRREEYFAFVERHPEMFVNPPGGFSILLKEDEIGKVEGYMAHQLEAEGMPIEWAQVGIVFQDQYGMILRDAVQFPDGSPGTYIRFVSESDGVGTVILPHYREQVLLLRHFRHATRRWHLEIPRGFGMAGLAAEENARRELEEEIGAKASQLVSLGSVYPDTGMDAALVELFYARIETYGPFDTMEGITEVLTVSVAEVEAMIRENTIADGFTIAAYTRAKLRGLL